MPIVTVEHLHKRYGAAVAVDDVSFTVEQGEIFGVLGPNGAGKTTTVEAIAGLRDRDGGRIDVLGLDPAARGDRDRLHELVGVQLQAAALPDRLRVGEAFELFSSFYRSPADWRALAEVLGLADRLDVRFAKLSGGQRQRLSAALALVGAPRIAILDELTTGLDPGARRDTWSLVEQIRDQGVTILLVTHFMEEAERLCDRVALIDAGRVVAIDSPDGLAAAVVAETRIRFRPSRPVADALFTDLPEVTALRRDGERIALTGNGDALLAVVTALSREGVTPEHLRVEQASLEDAFVALTAKH